ncbi:ubiquinone-binding protein [secondary endosymbiont of Ctenarytaina eucalypti]|uniref:Oligoketide cyclase/lipid transport protein n=1 Tax=secondary endosymbiont of Ctenarytaina eucalypti TaxID=1199245 RepID=J3TY22_9ENTR|nr:ubiquinone-binding protein [secondary endosymbiont of Ctenarytaina eucalypti]AFP85225.1 oligoketide cyclase/lipid transport protein [secondary endosymbiont of Ctenarytaina eucalypti]
MPHITGYALVPYSAAKMFALVNNISAYPTFIPGCTGSRVLAQNGSELTAEMNISKAGISKSFTTCNIITENQSIVMRLVDGPFSSFSGYWHFIPFGDEASKIEFNLDCEFNNTLITVTFKSFFKEIANNIVIAFTRRAKEVYQDAAYLSRGT